MNTPPGNIKKKTKKHRVTDLLSLTSLHEALKPIRDDLDITKRTLFHLREKIDAVADQTRKQGDNQWVHFLILVAIFVAFQAVMFVMSKNDSSRIS